MHMTNKAKNYLKLSGKFEEIGHLNAIANLAHWDSAVMLQAGSAGSRSLQTATFNSVIHRMKTAPEIGDLINASMEELPYLDEWEKANLRLIKKHYDEETLIPSQMQYEFSVASSESEFVWRSCRANNDFKTLIPYLERVFKAAIDIATIKAEAAGKSVYETMVDSFDPDRQVSEINLVYKSLKEELPGLIDQIVSKQSNEKVIKLTQKIDEATQKAIGIHILEAMGFDLTRGRLDKSTHPFCIGDRSDVRLTTRYDEDNFLSGLLGVIHEGGHGLYQQNLPEKYMNQPVGGPKGMAFHESQSLIMETQAGTSREFTEFLARILKDKFGLNGHEYSADNLYKLMTRVQRSFIRVEADEVTYPLHVILRAEIEQGIVAGSIKVADLPGVWNDKMHQYLGIRPESDRVGCLQDIHWPSGWLGYFPCYTNGAIIASMLMKRAKEQTNNAVALDLARGEFTNLNDFLTKNLREYGSLKPSESLLQASTGSATIDPLAFTSYLRHKYLE